MRHTDLRPAGLPPKEGISVLATGRYEILYKPVQ